MANFTIADIKALREQLGTGMVDTKKALEEADGDVEKAVEILRLKGAKGNAKRADRSTSEGLIAARELDGKVTLIEVGNKFAAHAGGDQSAQDHSDCSNGEDERFGAHHAIEQRGVHALGIAKEKVLLLADPIADEKRNRCRDERHRQNHRAEQCGDHGERHRVEHLSFNTREREDGQVHHHDDQLPEQ